MIIITASSSDARYQALPRANLRRMSRHTRYLDSPSASWRLIFGAQNLYFPQTDISCRQVLLKSTNVLSPHKKCQSPLIIFALIDSNSESVISLSSNISFAFSIRQFREKLVRLIYKLDFKSSNN